VAGKLVVELDGGDDGRWIADVVALEVSGQLLGQ
jgi:hypothetical protein